MELAAKVFAGIGAALHVLFFVMESVLFTRPDVYARFKMTAEQVDTVKIWALNQGFYNLFLAIGCAVGIALIAKKPQAGWALVVHACLFMFGAGVVLAFSEPTLIKAACVQSGPPAVALALAFAVWRKQQPGPEGQ